MVVYVSASLRTSNVGRLISARDWIRLFVPVDPLTNGPCSGAIPTPPMRTTMPLPDTGQDPFPFLEIHMHPPALYRKDGPRSPAVLVAGPSDSYEKLLDLLQKQHRMRRLTDKQYATLRQDARILTFYEILDTLRPASWDMEEDSPLTCTRVVGGPPLTFSWEGNRIFMEVAGDTFYIPTISAILPLLKPLGKSSMQSTGFTAVPAHYAAEREVIDSIRDNLTDEGFAGFCLGNSLKYRERAGRKGDPAGDAQKADWYMQMYRHVLHGDPDPRTARPGWDAERDGYSRPGCEE